MKNWATSERLVSQASAAHSDRKVAIATAQSRYIAPSASPGSRQKVTLQTGQVRLILKWERNIGRWPHIGQRLSNARLRRVLPSTRSIGLTPGDTIVLSTASLQRFLGKATADEYFAQKQQDCERYQVGVGRPVHHDGVAGDAQHAAQRHFVTRVAARRQPPQQLEVGRTQAQFVGVRGPRGGHREGVRRQDLLGLAALA